MGIAVTVGVLVIVAFVLGGTVGAGAMFLMERILHLHTPSLEEIGEIAGERISEDLAAYMDAMDGLAELREDDDE